MITLKHFKCRFCGRVFPAWLPVAKRPDGAMLLYHLSQQYPDEVGPYLDRMAADEDIGTVVAEDFEGVEDETSGRGQRSKGEESCRSSCGP